ncbi:hypothetical protein N9924_00670 [bacterium]|nr:hypothetical protein [bacterium]
MAYDPMEQAAKLAAKIFAQNNDWYKVALCGVCYEGGKEDLWVSGNTACHAGLNRDGYHGGGAKDIGNAIAVVSMYMTEHEGGGVCDKHKIMYLDWLLNRSPYQTAFLSKDAEVCVAEGYVVADPTQPSNMMVAGLVAQRRMWEYSYIARTWVSLVEEGCNEDMAYFYAHIISAGVKEEHILPDTTAKFIDCAKTCHVSFAVDLMSIKHLKAFVSHKPVDLNPPYNKCSSYNGMDNLYGRNGDYGASTIYENLGEEINVIKGEGGDLKNLNPFPPLNRDNDSHAYMDVIRAFVEFSNKQLKEMGL